MEDDIKLEYMGISSKDINNMQDYLIDYKRIYDALENVTNPDLEDCVLLLKQTLDESERSTYEEYKEKVDEFENFNVNDYCTNDGLKEEFERSKL